MPEVVERQNPLPSAAPAPAPVAGRIVGRLVSLSVLLMALAWGATVCYLPSKDSRFRRPWFHGGPIPVSPATAAGALAAAAIGVVMFRKFKTRLPFYKPGQARAVRVSTYVSFAALALFGCVAFHQLPPTASEWWGILRQGEFLGQQVAIRPILFPSAGIFLTAVVAAHLLMNRPSWAEFLIETEGELKKVYWPPRKEYVGSSVVVVVVVVVVAGFLFFVDRGLSRLMHIIGIGF